MLERLHALFSRSLQRHRAAWFALAVAVILVAALALAVLDDAGPAPEPRTERPPAAPQTPHTPVHAPANRPRTTAAPADDVADSKRAARRFLAHYLPFTYGQQDALHVPLITPQLRAEIVREQPRVPPSVQARTPRIDLLQVTGVTSQRVKIVALVSDGARYYSVPLELSKTADGWIVSDLWSF